MARKSPRKSGGTRRRPPAPVQPPVDRRALEKHLWDVGRLVNQRPFDSVEELNAFLQAHSGPGELPAPPPSTPLEQAQEIMYQAWGSRGRRRIQLAHQALSISEDCADAYVLLAEEEAKSAEEARELYERGVQAGERAIGAENLREWRGKFWGMIETRPYMRAREGLASVLWHLEQREEAVAHYQEMLRLNPGDNQGLRYVLASCLLEMGDDKALGRLLNQYKDEASAAWLYTRALWLFRSKGAGAKADAALREALAANPHVVAYLFGVKRLPKRPPDYVGIGDESEAIAYVIDSGPCWYQTPETVPWLIGIMEKMMAEGPFVESDPSHSIE